MEQIVDRRKYKRFNLLTDAVVFLRISWPEGATAAKIIEISPDGLRLFHMGSALPSDTPIDLDIVLPGRIAYLEELSGIIIFDSKY
ncbi:MAG: PilZ domain-containing protein [Deltaproteobacteria bacterium]|nr:PilZ domain-containing protein [Deltaproteobacteria bacterium]